MIEWVGVLGAGLFLLGLLLAIYGKLQNKHKYKLVIKLNRVIGLLVIIDFILAFILLVFYVGVAWRLG